MDALVEPITITCGHTFCRPCLVEVLSRSQKQCPTCRHATHIDPVTAQESTIIKGVLMRINSAAYAERQRAMEASRQSWTERHPIFFYNDCVFPTGQVRLMFFEERYKLMLQRAMRGSQTFIWVASYTPACNAEGAVGVLCKVRQAQPLADGRWIVMAEGERRVRLSETWEEPQTYGLWYAQAEHMTDADPGSLADTDQLARSLADTYACVQRYAARVPDRSRTSLPELPPLPAKPTAAQLELATWRLCAAVFGIVQLSTDRMPLGQGLLGMRTTSLRYEWAKACVDQISALLPIPDDDDDDEDEDSDVDVYDGEVMLGDGTHPDYE